MKIMLPSVPFLLAFLMGHATRLAQAQTEREGVSLDELIADAVECNEGLPTLDFVIVGDIAVNTAIEDDIRANLAVLGIDI